jgi:integrase
MGVKFPHPVVVGNATVKIYRVEHAKSGTFYTMAWHEGKSRPTRQFKDIKEALKESRLKAAQLNAGDIEAAKMSKEDRDELLAARRIVGDTPLLEFVKEAKKAADMCGDQLLIAAKSFASSNALSFMPLATSVAVETFLAEIRGAGKSERTYKSKLKYLVDYFPQRQLHSISTPEWTKYLEQFPDAVTRNDLRKRARTLCRWARSNGHLPNGDLAIDGTMKAPEAEPEVGIIAAETYGRLLRYLRDHHVDLLAPAVLLGFCGMRVEEVQGGRKKSASDPEPIRQRWSDVFLKPQMVEGRMEKPYLQVTNAKTNTPAWRHVPIPKAALEWLAYVPDEILKQEYVGSYNASDRIRRIGLGFYSRVERHPERYKGWNLTVLDLPDNCFRHSFITYCCKLRPKDTVANWAGNSVPKIDKNYRRPVAEASSRAWFEMTPSRAEQLRPFPMIDITLDPDWARVGGSVRSDAKKEAARRRVLAWMNDLEISYLDLGGSAVEPVSKPGFGK